MQGFAGGQAGLNFDKNQAIAKDDFGLNDKRFKSLVYPLQMNPENFYPEAMCFTIKKRVGLSIDQVAKIVGDEYKDRVKSKAVGRQANALRELAKTRTDFASETERQNYIAGVTQYEKEERGKLISSDFLDDLTGATTNIYEKIGYIRDNEFYSYSFAL